MGKTSKRVKPGAPGGAPGGVAAGSGVTKRAAVVPKGKTKKLARPKMKNVVNLGFRHAAVTTWAANKRRKKNGEAMGERGALEYLRSLPGPARPGDLEHPTDVAPFVLPAPGVPWPNAIAFNGSGVADVCWSNGTTFYVVEAKGGSSALKDHGPAQRMQHYDATGNPTDPNILQGMHPPLLPQGSVPYLMDVAHEMTYSPSTDGRVRVGQEILNAESAGTLRYNVVRTNRTEYNEENGDPADTVTVTIED